MSAAIAFFEKLLQQGEAVLHERPVFQQEDRLHISRMLEAAYKEYRLEVAGPILPFDVETGLAGALFLAQACWFLVNREESSKNVEKALHFPRSALSPEGQLSADLTLRYLAIVLKRARTRPPADPLPKALVEVLCHWPLSGVLADIAEPPANDLQFHNHAGLQLLYAERLAANPRGVWIPRDGRTREVCMLVFRQQGKALPAPTDERAAE